MAVLRIGQVATQSKHLAAVLHALQNGERSESVFMLPGRLAALLAAAAVLVVPGCGTSNDGQVSGIAHRADGTPLVGARVVARCVETGKSAYGTTDSDGQFELRSDEEADAVPAGNYDVVVLEDRGNPDNRRPPTIAAKYRDPATSTLQVIVEAGKRSTLNLTLDPS